jgi:GNAT superfamily N-acetyltransferase
MATVSPGTRADVPAVIDLIGRVFVEYGLIFDPPVEVADLFAFASHYEPPRGAFFVVREGDRIAGSIGVERVDEETAEIHRLYLDLHLRGQGVGRALVEAALAWCREQGIGHLVLWSDTRFDRSHVLYQRLGFEQTGIREVHGDINDSQEYRFERPV